MTLRYRCLLLRPDEAALDLPGFFLKNFEPGFHAFLQEELGFSQAELDTEYRIWRDHTERLQPTFYPGFLEALETYRSEGGRFVVVSHSESDIIRRHYEEAGQGLMPDAIFGRDAGPRKPDPWAVQETLRRFGFAPGEVLVVDDLRPGIEMALAAGVPAVAAGWAHRLPAIRAYMEANTLGVLDTVEDFTAFILQA